MTHQPESQNLPAVAAPMTHLPSQISVGGSGMDLILNPSAFDQLQRGAKLFSSSGLVNKSFKGNVGACFIGLQLAAALEMNPFMLFQKIYCPADGKIGMEAQLVVTLAKKAGLFKGPIRYEFSGAPGKPWSSKAGTRIGEPRSRSGRRCPS
jgi:hypothetical protein